MSNALVLCFLLVCSLSAGDEPSVPWVRFSPTGVTALSRIIDMDLIIAGRTESPIFDRLPAFEKAQLLVCSRMLGSKGAILSTGSTRIDIGRSDLIAGKKIYIEDLFAYRNPKALGRIVDLPAPIVGDGDVTIEVQAFLFLDQEISAVAKSSMGTFVMRIDSTGGR